MPFCPPALWPNGAAAPGPAAAEAVGAEADGLALPGLPPELRTRWMVWLPLTPRAREGRREGGR